MALGGRICRKREEFWGHARARFARTTWGDIHPGGKESQESLGRRRRQEKPNQRYQTLPLFGRLLLGRPQVRPALAGQPFRFGLAPFGDLTVMAGH